MEFLKRNVPKSSKLENPVNVAGQILVKAHKEKENLVKIIEQKDKYINELMSKLAVQVFELNRLMTVAETSQLEDIRGRVDITKRNLMQILTENEFKIVDLEGKQIDEELEDVINIVERVEGDRKYEYITQMVQPLILHKDKPVKPYPAVIVCNAAEDKK